MYPFCLGLATTSARAALRLKVVTCPPLGFGAGKHGNVAAAVIIKVLQGVVVSRSLLVQEQIDAKRVQLGPNKVLEAAARGAPGSVSSEGQRRTLARQMKRWRASLNPSRSPGTVGEKARCTERCAGCSCARGSAAGCAYRRPGWPTLAAGAWPKPATSWLGNCA